MYNGIRDHDLSRSRSRSRSRSHDHLSVRSHPIARHENIMTHSDSDHDRDRNENDDNKDGNINDCLSECNAYADTQKSSNSIGATLRRRTSKDATPPQLLPIHLEMINYLHKTNSQGFYVTIEEMQEYKFTQTHGKEYINKQLSFLTYTMGMIVVWHSGDSVQYRCSSKLLPYIKNSGDNGIAKFAQEWIPQKQFSFSFLLFSFHFLLN